MTKLRIALAITDLDVGGAEQALVQLATRLDRDRFEPVVYCLGPRPAIEEASCVPALERAAIEVHCLDARGIRSLPRVLARLRQLLVAQRPDLLQTFLFHANIVGRIAARQAGVPRIVSGIRVAEPRAWHRWVDRLTAGRVDRHVCVSQAVARHAAAAGLPAERLVVIPNGIDPACYPSPTPADLASLGIPAGRRAIVCIGRLDRQKGVDWLLESAGQWLGRLPDCDLLLVGEGPMRARLEALCPRRGLTARVHFAGWRSDVPQVLAACHLLVLPSRWEGMPNVLLQAMASRLPVVATDVEGVREVLGPLAERQVIPYGDDEALAQRLTSLLSTDEVQRLGGQNQARVAAEFPLTRMVERYQQLWTSLAGVAAP